MSLLGRLVGAVLVDEWGRREEEEKARKESERKMEDLRRQNDANDWNYGAASEDVLMPHPSPFPCRDARSLLGTGVALADWTSRA